MADGMVLFTAQPLGQDGTIKSALMELLVLETSMTQNHFLTALVEFTQHRSNRLNYFLLKWALYGNI